MKALIVAHPDDEIIWFSPQDFDLIVIAFLARHDKPYAESCRKLAIEAHPLKNRIVLLGIEESGFWKDGKRQFEFQKSEQALSDALESLKKQFVITEIYTHNAEGEYGHDDHILVNKIVSLLFHEIKIFSPLCNDGMNDSKNVITVKNDLNFYSKVKDIYIKNRAWTWKSDYIPPVNLYYSLNSGI